MRKRGGGHVRGIVEGLLTKLEKKTAPRGSAVIEAWEASVTPKALSHSRPVSFKKGVLVVVVENSSWLYRLTLEKDGIIKRFNENYPGKSKAQGLRFRIGTFED